MDISVNGKWHHIGLYSNRFVAWLAYKHAAIRLHGEFANYGHYRFKTAAEFERWKQED